MYILHTTISGLRQARDYFSQDELKTIYSSFIQPVFDHCNAVWGNLNKGLASKIQKLQNRAAHTITSQGYETRSADLHKFLVWDNLAMRRDQRLCFLMHDVIIKNVPEYVSKLFPMRCKSNPHKSYLVCTYIQNCSVNLVICLVYYLLFCLITERNILAQYEENLKFEEASLCAAIECLRTDDVICPVCKRLVASICEPITIDFFYAVDYYKFT